MKTNTKNVTELCMGRRNQCLQYTNVLYTNDIILYYSKMAHRRASMCLWSTEEQAEILD